MGHLPQGYLKKKGRQWRSIRLLDLSTLLFNIYNATADDEVGFEDAQETLETLTRKLETRRLVDPSHLESALWSCNLLHERGKFFDPKGRSFEQFVKDLIGTDKFHPTYNVIENKDDN